MFLIKVAAELCRLEERGTGGLTKENKEGQEPCMHQGWEDAALCSALLLHRLPGVCAPQLNHYSPSLCAGDRKGKPNALNTQEKYWPGPPGMGHNSPS